MVIVGGYAGLSDSFDGASHQSVNDISVIRSMPNIKVIVPADAIETQQAVKAALTCGGPVYIRLCRNPVPVLFEDADPLEIGKIRKMYCKVIIMLTIGTHCATIVPYDIRG